MDNHEARIILEKLFEGVHPETGEVFAEDHVCNDPQVLRALYSAIAALNGQPAAAEAPKAAKQNHENNKKVWAQEEDAYLGLPWYPEENEKLTALYRDGRKPNAMAAAMKRSVNGIMCRLEKPGLIESRYEYTAPEEDAAAGTR